MSICHMESSNRAERGAGGPESGSQRRAAWGWLGTALGAGSLYCLAPGWLGHLRWGQSWWFSSTSAGLVLGVRREPLTIKVRFHKGV